jgi:hypothetical protein
MPKSSLQVSRSKSSDIPTGISDNLFACALQGTQKRQNGNALWFILIVVALFGALAATLSRNSGTVNQAGDVEQARVKASSILRYTTSIQTAIQRMVLEGMSENDLDFSDLGTDYENPNCTDDRCKIFKTDGGGIPYLNLSSVVSSTSPQDWVVSAQNFIYLAGCDSADNTCTDLILVAPNIPKAVCLQVNSMQGITNTNDAPPQMGSFLIDEKFNGTFTSTISNHAIGGTNASTEATEVQGRNAACVEVSGTYYFYQLLLAR